MLARILAVIELNLFATVLVGATYGVIFVLIFREIRRSHQALRDMAASLATIVRELHNR